MFVHMNVHIYFRRRLEIWICIYIYKYMYMYAHICTQEQIRTYACKHLHIHLCTCRLVCTFLFKSFLLSIYLPACLHLNQLPAYRTAPTTRATTRLSTTYLALPLSEPIYLPIHVLAMPLLSTLGKVAKKPVNTWALTALGLHLNLQLGVTNSGFRLYCTVYYILYILYYMLSTID